MLVQLNDNLELLHEMIYQSVGNELSQDNFRAFVDLIQGSKEQENIEVKVEEGTLLFQQTNCYRSAVRQM